MENKNEINALVVMGTEQGITEKKSASIIDAFMPMVKVQQELEIEYGRVSVLEMSDDTADQASELHKKYVKLRTTTDKIRKEQKDFYLKAGKFVDSIAKSQRAVSDERESKLKEMKDYYVNLEKQKIAALFEERKAALIAYGQAEETIPDACATWPMSVWDNYLTGVKVAFEAQQRAIKEQEEREAKEVLKQKLRNDRNMIIAPYRHFLEGNDLLGVDLGNIVDSEFKNIIDELRNRKKKHDEEQEKIKAESERLIKEREAERKAKEEVDRKLREKEDAEKAAAEKAAKEEADRKDREARKGDADKINDLVLELDTIKSKYKFTADSYVKMFDIVCGDIDKIIKIIKG